MNAVLHKRASEVARAASLELTPMERPPTPSVRDERELEIDRLKAEREDLQQRLRAAEGRRDGELAEVRAEARRLAAQEFAQDDARRIKALGAALDQAVGVFETQVIAQARQLAPALAGAGLQRLVAVRQDEDDWLLRVIGRRLDSLNAQAVVEVHVAAAELSEQLAAQLAQRVAAGVRIVADPVLAPGTARISLRLGEVVVDPAAGLDRLLAALVDEGKGDD